MTVKLIPRREAIPPCLDGGWVAPDLVIPHVELVEIPRSDLVAFERVVSLPGVEITAEPLGNGIRVHHRRPNITMLDAWHDA